MPGVSQGLCGVAPGVGTVGGEGRDWFSRALYFGSEAGGLKFLTSMGLLDISEEKKNNNIKV